jgi:hypothetical protein
VIFLVCEVALNRFALVVLTALLAGCGSSGATVVEGKITYKGQPVTTGLVNFMVDGGRPLGGAIKPDGGYSFELPPGDYRVRVDTPPPAGAAWVEGQPAPTLKGKAAEGQVPPKFANYGTSGLTLTVGSESPQPHDFALE